jgi:hypothetical protein
MTLASSLDNTLLITGHRKGGTTLLLRLFDGHPQLNCYPTDLSLLYAYFPLHYLTLNQGECKNRISTIVSASLSYALSLATDTRFDNCIPDRFVEHIWNGHTIDDFETKESAIASIRNAWISYNNLNPDNIFVFKETGQLPRLYSTLSQASAQIVNIVRDPRSNYAAIKRGLRSYYSHHGHTAHDLLAATIYNWQTDVQACLLAREINSIPFHMVEYEGLVCNTSNTLYSLAERLGISPFTNYSPTILGQACLGNSFNKSSNQAKVHSTNLDLWKEELEHWEICAIEYILASLMERIGYKVSATRDEMISHISEFFDTFNHRHFYRDPF